MNISKKENTEKDWFVKIMIIQTIVAILFVICLFFSAHSDNNFALMMRSEYQKLMSTDITITDISDTLDKIIGYTSVFSQNLKIDDAAENQQLSVDNDENLFVYEESESISVGGGEDLQFSSLDTLEGICFDEYSVDFSVIVPVDDYKVTSGFGYRISPITEKAGLHTGIDLATDYGKPIYAAADGIVIESSYDNSYGNYIKMQHHDDYITIYAHCSSLCVDEGDRIDQGDIIAKVGSTGSSTGNHLHFEIRKDNIRINPEYALPDL